MYHQFKELAEVDITTDPMEVGPTLHYFMGGIRVDSDTQQTCVPGLFACGECSGGMHGANRLGGNSLSDLLVFGALAGQGAREYIDALGDHPQPPDEDVAAAMRRATDILNREEGSNPYLVHEALQTIMNDGVNIVRDSEGLARAISELEALRTDVERVRAPGSSQYNPGWHEALSLRSLMITAESVTRAALVRQESRGAHTRTDFPGEQEAWQKVHLVTKRGAEGEMQVRQEPAAEPPPELLKIAMASLEELEGAADA
jgi:succinate dehydrogenase / fumarate reductase flavoprotein subunit